MTERLVVKQSQGRVFSKVLVVYCCSILGTQACVTLKYMADKSRTPCHSRKRNRNDWKRSRDEWLSGCSNLCNIDTSVIPERVPGAVRRRKQCVDIVACLCSTSRSNAKGRAEIIGSSSAISVATRSRIVLASLCAMPPLKGGAALFSSSSLPSDPTCLSRKVGRQTCSLGARAFCFLHSQ